MLLDQARSTSTGPRAGSQPALLSRYPVLPGRLLTPSTARSAPCSSVHELFSLGS